MTCLTVLKPRRLSRRNICMGQPTDVDHAQCPPPRHAGVRRPQQETAPRRRRPPHFVKQQHLPFARHEQHGVPRGNAPLRVKDDTPHIARHHWSLHAHVYTAYRPRVVCIHVRTTHTPGWGRVRVCARVCARIVRRPHAVVLLLHAQVKRGIFTTHPSLRLTLGGTTSSGALQCPSS